MSRSPLPAFGPLAQVRLSFDPGASVRDVDLSVAGLDFEAIVADHVPAQLDLYITVSSAVNATWSGSIIYATDLFDRSTVEGFARRLNRILAAMVASYERLFGRRPVVTAIHAGLECGIIRTNYPHLDMISFGPTICYPHSPDEKVSIPSVERFWNYLLETLRSAPEK